MCHTFLSDDTFCDIYDGSRGGDCSRLSNATCTLVGSSPVTYELAATTDLDCDTLPYE